jgi:hypothetical protein
MNLHDDPLIKALHRNTEVELDDLLMRKLFIEPAEQPLDWLNRNPEMLAYYASQGRLPKLDPIPAEFWSLKVDDQLSDSERERFRKAGLLKSDSERKLWREAWELKNHSELDRLGKVRRNVSRIVHAAALHVLAVTDDGLTKTQRSLIFDRVRYVTAEVYEESMRKGGQTIGKLRKRKDWAEDLADYLVGLGVSFPKAWASITADQYWPFPLNENVAVYRSEDSKRVYFIDHVTDGELGSQSRSNFRKRYFPLAK